MFLFVRARYSCPRPLFVVSCQSEQLHPLHFIHFNQCLSMAPRRSALAKTNDSHFLIDMIVKTLHSTGSTPNWVAPNCAALIVVYWCKRMRKQTEFFFHAPPTPGTGDADQNFSTCRQLCACSFELDLISTGSRICEYGLGINKRAIWSMKYEVWG